MPTLRMLVEEHQAPVDCTYEHEPRTPVIVAAMRAHVAHPTTATLEVCMRVRVCMCVCVFTCMSAE